MKKILVTTMAIAISISAIAQTVSIEAAKLFIAKGDWANAKKSMDEATMKESKNSETYFLKAIVYQSIADDDKTASLAPDGHAVALENYKKYMLLEPKYKMENVKPNLTNLVIANFNKAINAYNAQKYSEALGMFNAVNEITKLENGKIFGGDKFIDTVNTQSTMYKGYCNYFDKKQEDARPLFESVVDNPIVKDADLYLRLVSIYQSSGAPEKWIGMINKAKVAFPNNKDIKNEEINYYILTNKQDLLAQKLEETIKAEPNNAEMHFSLGTTYENMANVKGAKPVNYDELIKKAAAAYEKAVSLDANKGDYAYNLGALFFNQAVEVNSKMNEVLKDKAKYDALDKTRKALFAKSTPILEKAMGLFETGGVKESDKMNYRNTLMALQEMFKVQKMDTQRQAITSKISNL
jgi:tetratricopeptide (TPR) repeat protein